MPNALVETTTVKRERVIPEFGEQVRRVLEEHGLSLRAARIRTGIDHVTISDMASGYVPRLEKVEQFARAFGLDVNEWRELAGYPPIEPTPDEALRTVASEEESVVRSALGRMSARDRQRLQELFGNLDEGE